MNLAGGPLVLVESFASMPSSVAAARAWTSQQLALLGTGPATIDLMELLISEVVTNAVRHGGGSDVTLKLVLGTSIEASVHDDGHGAPRPRPAGVWDDGGRGLHLVAELADAWGIRADESGKWVWFRVGPPGRRRRRTTASGCA